MTIARSLLVDVSVTPWYHVISKTVRGAFLLREGDEDRKQWLEDRIEELSQLFAIAVGGFSVLDNHLHLAVRLEPERVDQWSDEEVVRRWATLFPPRGKNRKPLEVTQQWIEQKLADQDQKYVTNARKRLANLGWFMKCLKEPLARLVNRAEGTTGAFWQGRYKSIAILDEQALLATCAYIDLNPFAAGLSELPEESPYTSIRTRLNHCRSKGRLNDLKAARIGTVAGVRHTVDLESDVWLCPIEDRRRHGAEQAGLVEGFSLGSYVQLIDWTSRLVRSGKARVSADVTSLLDRLGTNSEIWSMTLKRLFSRNKTTGVAFSFNRQRLKEAAQQRGCHHMANLNGCPA